MSETKEQLEKIKKHFKSAYGLIHELGNCDDEGKAMSPSAWMHLGVAREAAEKGEEQTSESLKFVGWHTGE